MRNHGDDGVVDRDIVGALDSIVNNVVSIESESVQSPPKEMFTQFVNTEGIEEVPALGNEDFGKYVSCISMCYVITVFNHIHVLTTDIASIRGDFSPSHQILKEIGDALSVDIGKEMEGYTECEALIKVHMYRC